MSYLYKQFSKLIVKWPLEEGKCAERQFRYHLERNLVKEFKLEHNEGNIIEPMVEDSFLCKRRLKALESLYENKFLHQYPNNYKTGHMGLNLQQLKLANSEEARRKLGIRRAKSSTNNRWAWFQNLLKRK